MLRSLHHRPFCEKHIRPHETGKSEKFTANNDDRYQNAMKRFQAVINLNNLLKPLILAKVASFYWLLIYISFNSSRDSVCLQPLAEKIIGASKIGYYIGGAKYRAPTHFRSG